MTTPIPATLVLFDLDGTLLDTQDAGIRGYEAAGKDALGVSFSFKNIPLHGKLDSQNYREAIQRHAPELDTEEHEAKFKVSYLHHIGRIGAERGGFTTPRGAREAIEELASKQDVEVGILTGNWQEPGRLKLELARIDHDSFAVCAWAEDGSTRNDLVPVARARFIDLHGSSPAQIIVIGDTPRDIECAHAHGALGVGVATGIHDTNALRQAGADLVLNDLTDMAPLRAILHPDSGG